MKKFVFPLQKVLDVRELEEKGKMKEVAKAQENHNQETELFDHLQAEERMSMKAMSGLRSKNVNAGMVNILMNNLEGQHQKVIDQDKKMLEAQAALDQRRLELLDTSKKKKIMEKLKELKFSKFQDRVQKEEQKFIDETAIVRAYHKPNND